MPDDTISPVFQTLETRYGRLTVFAHDTGAATRSLALYGEWAENELRFLQAMIEPGARVLDVGAYIGTHTLALSRFAGPFGQVVSFEPQPATFALLTKNVEANGLGNVRLENAVASFEPGRIAIHPIDIEREGSFGSASLVQAVKPDRPAVPHESPLAGPGETEVRAITIDSLELADCALIKIDAEGMEDLVLRGASDTIRRCRPIVYAECNSLEEGLRSAGILKSQGYRVRAHVVPAFNPDNFKGEARNIFDGACEVALVGFDGPAEARIADFVPHTGELLLPIETADDLVLALLNKPQYPHEILRQTAAARCGGDAHLDRQDAIRSEIERQQNDIAALRQSIARQQEDVDRVLRQTRETHAAELAGALGEKNDELARAGETAAAELAAERSRAAADRDRQIVALGQAHAADLARMGAEKDRESAELRTRSADELAQAIRDHEARIAGVRQEAEREILAVRKIAAHQAELADRNEAAARDRLERAERALAAKIDACLAETAFLRKDNSRLQGENARSAQESGKLRDGMAEAAAEAQSLRAQAAATEAALTTASAALAAARTELTTVNAYLTVTRTELNSVRSDLAATRAELAALRESRSWRLTAPLRAAINRIRRGSLS